MAMKRMTESKYTPKSVYGTLFSVINQFSEDDQEYVLENLVTDKFLADITDNPKAAYGALNEVVQNIENGKKDRMSKIFKPFKDKIYMMKNMLKDYGNF